MLLNFTFSISADWLIDSSHQDECDFEPQSCICIDVSLFVTRSVFRGWRTSSVSSTMCSITPAKATRTHSCSGRYRNVLFPQIMLFNCALICDAVFGGGILRLTPFCFGSTVSSIIIDVKAILVLLRWHSFPNHFSVTVYMQPATSLKSCTASTRGNLFHTDHHFPLCCHSLPVQYSFELLCTTCLIQFADEITSYISININQVFHWLMQYFLKRLPFPLHSFLLPLLFKALWLFTGQHRVYIECI